MTLFERITQNKEALAEYLLQSCDNPLSETNEDMCDFCDIMSDGGQCNEESCLQAILKGLDCEVGQNLEDD